MRSNLLRDRNAHQQSGASCARSFQRAGLLVTSVISTAIAALLGVGLAGSTYAFLNTSGSIPGATIQSGSFHLYINDGSGAELDGWQVSPETPEANAFSVTNDSDSPADVSFRILGVSEEPFSKFATAKFTAVDAAEDCTVQLAGEPATLNGFATPQGFSTLPSHSTGWYCLEVGFRQETPATMTGQAFTFLFFVTGVQSAH